MGSWRNHDSNGQRVIPLHCYGFGTALLEEFRGLVARLRPQQFVVGSIFTLGEALSDPTGIVLVNFTNRPGGARTSIPRSKGSASITAIALIEQTTSMRHQTYANGFDDYVSVPLIFDEIAFRLMSARRHQKTLGDDNELPSDPVLKRACRFMEEQSRKNVTLAEICQYAGTNHNTLTRKFKTEFNMTPMAWQRDQRLLRAADLLVSTTESVISIAERLNFSDANNFSTAFKRRFGKAPLAYRKGEYGKGFSESIKGSSG